MKDKCINAIKEWKSKVSKLIELDKIYIFGSVIYMDGSMFNPKDSDLDLIMTIPRSLTSSIERTKWITKVKGFKKDLEQKLLFILKKEDANIEIVSIVPITQAELQRNIHKGGSRNFFKVNDFLDIDTNSILKGGDKFQFITQPNEFIVQVIESIQKARNDYLKISANNDYCKLDWSGEDILPKEIARDSAKIFSLVDDKVGDEFNTSFGCDFIKGKVRELSGHSMEYFELYKWIDDRSGGRFNTQNKDKLEQEKYLLLYELLMDEIIELLSKIPPLKTSPLEVSNSFSIFLDDSSLLKRAHSQKENIYIKDIFVYPELAEFDDEREFEEIINSKKLVDNISKYKLSIIAGSDQSGKTTLCKKLFLEFSKLNKVPIYLSDKNNRYVGKISNKIKTAFTQQYATDISFNEFSKEDIVIIVDDFHFANKKEKIILELSEYKNQILIVDDIFELNINDVELINQYKYLTIEEFSPTLRNNLIKKWIQLSDDEEVKIRDNDFYSNIDKSTENINMTLGKMIGSGIMPAYPFFIISIMSTNEAFNKPLEQEITSQGHCYQALIYMYFNKHGVMNDEIDTYINFLTEFSMHLYREKKKELSKHEFNEFKRLYFKEFNSTIKPEKMVNILINTNILMLDNFNNYSFSYLYLYYFFVSRYLADNLKRSKKQVKKIFKNLHKNENAYIAVFISHHSKDDFVLNKIILNSTKLFKDFKLAKLTTEELSSFDKKADLIAHAVLPDNTSSPEKAREEKLKSEDHIERKKTTKESNVDDNKTTTNQNEDSTYSFDMELRRALKTVEVMGAIIKNRAGSMKKDNLERMFENGLNVHLRILDMFITATEDADYQQSLLNRMTKKINKLVREKGRQPEKRVIKNIAEDIFWNMNFCLVYAVVNKIIQSLGSNQLINITKAICDKNDTPITFIIKHGILMKYNKNLQIDVIANKFNNKDFSITAKNILKHYIVSYSSSHKINYKEKKKIQSKLKIPSRALLHRISHSE